MGAKILAKERSYPGKYVPIPNGYYTMECHCTNCDNTQTIFVAEGVDLDTIVSGDMVPCDRCKLTRLIIHRGGWQNVR